MSSERPRRRRRSGAPATSLPRPTSAEAAQPLAQRAQVPQVRAHHVTKDYSYVRSDLLAILVVGLISFGFIGVTSFVVR